MPNSLCHLLSTISYEISIFFFFFFNICIGYLQTILFIQIISIDNVTYILEYLKIISRFVFSGRSSMTNALNIIFVVKNPHIIIFKNAKLVPASEYKYIDIVPSQHTPVAYTFIYGCKSLQHCLSLQQC